MRLKEKFYRKFCAPEVRMLLDHMEENFEDFEEDYIDKKPWRRLMKSNTYTNVERKAIEMAYDRVMRGHERQKLLGKIIAQKLNPEVPQSPQPPQALTAMTTASYQQHLMAQQQLDAQIRNQLAQFGHQYLQDPRAIYGRTP
jgi:2-methylcitrate dehydratase PrpD